MGSGLGAFGAVLLVGCGGLLVVGIIAAVWLIGVYNRLASGRVGVRGAWADIDVQLKRRHDLIPNLVETVKGYASHEREALEAVIAARARAVAAPSMPDRVAAESGLTQALGRLMAVAEAYPDLKANQNFLQLQGELTSTENIIGGARGGYNNTVGAYNQSLVVFPTNIVANMFGFREESFFEVDDASQRNAPQVKF
ncbi:MAG: hypothetical protein RL136_192 [Planctomycetota bacterium]|jgi:LemA protein